MNFKVGNFAVSKACLPQQRLNSRASYRLYPGKQFSIGYLFVGLMYSQPVSGCAVGVKARQHVHMQITATPLHQAVTALTD